MTMKSIDGAFARLLKAFLTACLIAAAARQAQAAVACPVLLVDGQFDPQGVELTFRNSGKLPIQRLELGCTPRRPGAQRLASCHTETGVFFPGNPYTIRFSYPLPAARSMVVFPKAAWLSDGYRWTSAHDRSCRPLRISRRR